MVEMARHSRTRSRAIQAGVAAIALSLLAACSPPGGDGPAQGSDEPTDVSTDLGSEPITLTLYDGAGLKAIDDALIAAFEDQYENVTITTRFDPDDVQAVNAPRVLASDNPPDIARVIALSDIAQDGLLTPLDAWADLYGWEDIPEGQLAMYRVDDEGVRGSGTQYSMASGFTVTGVYYNKTLLADLGIAEPPTTIAEFESALETAKAADVTPIMAGNQSGQIAFVLQMMINDAIGAQAMNDWVFNAPEATIDTPDAADAAQLIADWADEGYFPSDTNGTDATLALGRFARGEALFYGSGNWDAAALETQMGDDVGFVLPPVGASGTVLAMSDPVSNFAIPAGSQNKDAAAAFLDFLTSPEARQVAVDAGFAPSGTGDEPSTTAGSLNAEVQEAFATLVASDGQVQFMQNATNGTSAAWNSQVQLLVAGRASGADVVAFMQDKFEQDLGR